MFRWQSYHISLSFIRFQTEKVTNLWNYIFSIHYKCDYYSLYPSLLFLFNEIQCIKCYKKRIHSNYNAFLKINLLSLFKLSPKNGVPFIKISFYFYVYVNFIHTIFEWSFFFFYCYLNWYWMMICCKICFLVFFYRLKTLSYPKGMKIKLCVISKFEI